MHQEFIQYNRLFKFISVIKTFCSVLTIITAKPLIYCLQEFVLIMIIERRLHKLSRASKKMLMDLFNSPCTLIVLSLLINEDVFFSMHYSTDHKNNQCQESRLCQCTVMLGYAINFHQDFRSGGVCHLLSYNLMIYEPAFKSVLYRHIQGN